ESATGPGMVFSVVGIVDMTDVAVSGAAGVGIRTDTLGVLRGMRVLVDAISGPDAGHPFGRTFDVVRSGVVMLDSVTATGGFASFDVAGLSLRNADLGQNIAGGVF